MGKENSNKLWVVRCAFLLYIFSVFFLSPSLFQKGSNSQLVKSGAGVFKGVQFVRLMFLVKKSIDFFLFIFAFTHPYFLPMGVS